ncbi:MAG: XTP/dITP diphosphatase [Patescibacteria group bacterium]
MRRLVLATRNEGKLNEVKALLGDLDLELVDLTSYPGAPEVEEDQPTFAGNARRKALAIAAHTGEWALADDSGLEVKALHGAPGVHSARYAGMYGDDAANMKKLLAELRDVPGDRREARFTCALALATPDGRIIEAEGECKGRIGFGPKGSNGFGYDPLFFLPEYGRMMAELTEEEKNRLSHRARAIGKLRPALKNLLAQAKAEH